MKVNDDAWPWLKGPKVADADEQSVQGCILMPAADLNNKVTGYELLMATGPKTDHLTSKELDNQPNLALLA